MKKLIKTTLKDVCIETFQRDPRSASDERFIYIDIASINRDQKTIQEYKAFLGFEAPSRARKEIKAGDVIVSTVRPNLNAVAVVPTELDGEIASTGFCILRPDQSKILSRYLFYFVCTKDFVEYLVKRTSGANYPAVTDAVVKSAPLNLPSLPEQQRIVHLLDEADGLRKLRTQTSERMEEFIPALFHEMFENNNQKSKWQVIKLEKVISRITNGYVGPTRDIYRDEGVPYILSKHIKAGEIYFDSKTFISKDFNQKNSKSILQENDVLVVQTGQIGETAVVRKDHVGHNCHALIVITPIAEFLIGDFLSAYFRSDHGSKHLISLQTGATLKHLNCGDVKKIEFAIPPLYLQHEFAQRVQEAREIEARQAQSAGRVEALYQSMLSRAFAGEL